MCELGILGEQEHITVEAQDDYARLFSESLSQEHVTALAAPFGWIAPIVFVDPDQELCLVVFVLAVQSFCFPVNLSSILFWNVRDLHRRARHNSVSDVVPSTKLDIVCL
jgi:hypothetical protein